MTIPHEILIQFCETDPDTYGFERYEHPFNIDGFTFATDGHILLRVPEDTAYSQNKPIDAVLRLCWPAQVNNLTYAPLFSVNPPVEEVCNRCKGVTRKQECDECDGDGFVTWSNTLYNHDYEAECKSCEGTGEVCECQECDGTGKKRAPQTIDIGGSRFNRALLFKITSLLHDVKMVIPAEGNLSTVHFTFDGGDGLVMPMRKEY